ncbi:hypothetical protein GCM10009789_83060 [Kribbella sancticallisti]|uniref:Helix-turn-helix domain-containing protein n=1 Tax=Kribbella sancticallisti TaxID=460087 RepID=A0ABP4QSL3_9ACTN
MGKELTERQAELLQAVRLISEHHKAVKAQEAQLKILYDAAIRAAAVEGVRQTRIADATDLSDGRISQIVKRPDVKLWWSPDRNGISPRDEWLAWLDKHPEPPQ